VDFYSIGREEPELLWGKNFSLKILSLLKSKKAKILLLCNYTNNGVCEASFGEHAVLEMSIFSIFG
jgi:hypothetical protein